MFRLFFTSRVPGGDRDAHHASGPARAVGLKALPPGGREQSRGGVAVGHLLDAVSSWPHPTLTLTLLCIRLRG